MDLSYALEQEQLREVMTALLEKHATPEQVREAEPLGFDADLWERIIDLGVVSMGVPESCGGGGAGMVELGLVAELCGAALAPVPFVEAPVVARALARANASLTGLTESPATFAPRPTRGGVARLVPFGAVADRVIALDGDALVLAELTPPGTSPRNLGCTAVSDVPSRTDQGASAVTTLVDGTAAITAHAAAVAEWKVLMAAALAGLSRRALDIGVAYVKERHQFGRPIGAFQAVAHRLADVATEVDGAQLLWQEAAWAADAGDTSAPALAAMAFAFSSEVAERSALTSLHFHGGYGFMLEYDIQLYARRAKAWPLAIGSHRHAVGQVADVLYGQVR